MLSLVPSLKVVKIFSHETYNYFLYIPKQLSLKYRRKLTPIYVQKPISKLDFSKKQSKFLENLDLFTYKSLCLS